MDKSKSLSDCDLNVSDLNGEPFVEESVGDGQKSQAGVESINITDESIQIDSKPEKKEFDDINRKEMPIETFSFIDDFMPKAEKLVESGRIVILNKNK